MKISRVTIITLGVTDLRRATEFYESVLGTPPNTAYGNVTFIFTENGELRFKANAAQ